MAPIAGNTYGSVALDRPAANGEGTLVSGTGQRYRREFTDASLSVWDVVSGSGHTVTAGTGPGLVVTTGTTINTETSLTSKATFSVPFKAAFGFKTSQKIANQDFFLEVVAVDPTDLTSRDETVVAAWRISGNDSTTTTVARVETRNGQAARSQIGGNLTVAAQTSDGIYEIVVESDEVTFHNKGMDSSAQKSLSVIRNSVVPDPNRLYKLRYRFANTGTAPATSTTITSAFASVVDYAEMLVEVMGAQGAATGSSSLPVNITGGNVGLSNGTIGASTGTTGTSMGKVLSAASTNATNLKSTAGRLYGYGFTNTTAAVKFVRLYNKATAPTVGTDSPVLVLAVPPNNSIVAEMTIPATFGTGISFAITGAFADLDATAVAAGDVVGYFLWL